VLQWTAGFILPAFVPEAKLYGFLGGFIGGGLVVALWWLFFSRAPWIERFGALVLMPLAAIATRYMLDPSIAKAGMGILFPIFAVPVLSLALVAWAVVCCHLPAGIRRVSLLAATILACGVFTVVRTGGVDGDGNPDLHWRWSPTPEQRLLRLADDEPEAHPPTSPRAKVSANWPGFRGPGRDGVARGVKIATDWSKSPPVELWRRDVGPAWSSFAVQGDLFYTQEQRGEEEAVSCYSVTTGQPVWRHNDAVRFWESNAGAGPRATPTLSNGRVYTCGATGIANALDAADGTVVWSHNAAVETGKKIPGWGFAGSPLIVDDEVIFAMSGRLVAYDAATGKRRWLSPEGGGGYSSAHLASIAGVKQVLLVDGDSALSFAPDTGAQLWKCDFNGDGIVQPALTAGGDILLGSGSGMGGSVTGVRRISVSRKEDNWATEERWTSAGIKAQFNDFVVQEGHAYGFDGNFLACIDLADGKRLWKGGRYGHGQVILLADQDLLLVLSEKGDLALVSATPDDFRELGRIPAITGKTWNHPALAGDIVLVRNDHKMAAFRLGR
jgi:outer membrane protein assembly factor BamB